MFAFGNKCLSALSSWKKSISVSKFHFRQIHCFFKVFMIFNVLSCFSCVLLLFAVLGVFFAFSPFFIDFRCFLLLWSEWATDG